MWLSCHLLHFGSKSQIYCILCHSYRSFRKNLQQKKGWQARDYFKEKTMLAGAAVSFSSKENLPSIPLFLQDIFPVNVPYLGGKIKFLFLRGMPTVIAPLFLRASLKAKQNEYHVSHVIPQVSFRYF